MQEEEADAVLTEPRHPEEVSLIDFNIDQILQNDKYYKRY